jgi:hypothetical protein
MPARASRADVVRELEMIRDGGGQSGDQNFEQYLRCEKLQESSKVVGSAVAVVIAREQTGAFTARTHTPLPSPPGWLPPPI